MKIKTFQEFWPFYQGEHKNPVNRMLHYIGTMLVHLILVYSIYYRHFNLLFMIPIAGYSFAWIGHFVIEKNRPATFTYPLWSLIADFKMFYQFIFKLFQ